ncbi:MAG: hypothetical protein U1F42_01485 [Candidatus Competibacteraceae bacterium]
MRINGLLTVGAISALRRNLDTCLIFLGHSANQVMKSAQVIDPPQKLISGYLDTVLDCSEKSWQDFRNNLQILLLTQDEALLWMAKIDRTLATH